MPTEKVPAPHFSLKYGPLSGMKSSSSGSIIAGTLLGDLGAVIHIERPDIGDTLRVLPPFYEVSGKKIGGEFVCVKRNELSVALDIRNEEGKYSLNS